MARIFEGIVQATWRGLVVPIRHLSGLVWSRLNSPHRARLAFSRVLELRPDHYGACLGLGRALLRLEEFDAAAAAFQRARRIDPIRFDTTREAMFLLHERETLKDLEDAFDDGTFEREPGSYLQLPTSFVAPPPSSCTEGATRKLPRSNTKAFRFKDFNSFEEYRRFRDVPPIRREDVATVDWDQLLDDINRR
jgi:tetratricopeptide (TPR) repeat protein